MLTVSSADGLDLKISRGSTRLGGTNPTVVQTGLSQVFAAVASIRSGDISSGDPAIVSIDHAAGQLSIYAWAVDALGSLTASASTDLVDWIAFGL